jgi:hypothetical protein
LSFFTNLTSSSVLSSTWSFQGWLPVYHSQAARPLSAALTSYNKGKLSQVRIRNRNTGHSSQGSLSSQFVLCALPLVYLPSWTALSLFAWPFNSFNMHPYSGSVAFFSSFSNPSSEHLSTFLLQIFLGFRTERRLSCRNSALWIRFQIFADDSANVSFFARFPDLYTYPGTPVRLENNVLGSKNSWQYFYVFYINKI